ncbi:TlpA family protein disulfide reductase [Croceitalea rosinachiae]|uniref:TlpA disulfide reductase family protein n=1 Tax=Croceitalea rosinachiae TaxID=3075596 RepID=A0ABU3AAK4_9FLAO|nr:TlpA disulfide reductase family protein [Croceitalea sp. F388]MDT0606103.1 TlpA disulfide reductase family protein [Croceitalea sp. F388]
MNYKRIKNRFKASDVFFGIFILALLIPQTRKPIQVAVNKVKVLVWSPSAKAAEDQAQLPPFDYHVKTLDGQLKTIEIGKGKPTFISYWATWCAPCLAELPSIEKLYAEYGEQINFVLLTNEQLETLEAFLKKKPYALPIFTTRMAPPTLLLENSIPTNYLIDQDGKIIIKETGAADWNSESVRRTIDTLLE